MYIYTHHEETKGLKMWSQCLKTLAILRRESLETEERESNRHSQVGRYVCT